MWISSAGPTLMGTGCSCSGGFASGAGLPSSGMGICMPGICWCWAAAGVDRAVNASALAANDNSDFKTILREETQRRMRGASSVMLQLASAMTCMVRTLMLGSVAFMLGLVLAAVLAAIHALVLGIVAHLHVLMLLTHRRGGRRCRLGGGRDRRCDQCHHFLFS